MALQKKVKKRNPLKWHDSVDKEEPTQEDIEREMELLARTDDDDYFPEEEQ